MGWKEEVLKNMLALLVLLAVHAVLPPSPPSVSSHRGVTPGPHGGPGVTGRRKHPRAPSGKWIPCRNLSTHAARAGYVVHRHGRRRAG